MAARAIHDVERESLERKSKYFHVCVVNINSIYNHAMFNLYNIPLMLSYFKTTMLRKLCTRNKRQ